MILLPTRIVLHHSLTKDGTTVSWDAIRRYHKETNGWRDIGYHYGIELINDHYEILVGRMVTEVGAHTAGQNSLSLGICFIGNFDITPVPLEMLKLGARLVRSLCDVFKIPFSEIHGHNEYAPKTCPGKLFDRGRFIREVTAIKW